MQAVTKRLWLMTLLLSACVDADRDRASVPRATPADAVAACQQFTRDGLKLKARSLAGLQAEVGRPAQTDVDVVTNRHIPTARDSIFRLEYDGLTVQLRKPGPGGELFEYVAVSNRKWLNYPYFRPGVSAANVIAVLGEPHRRDGNRLIYNCGVTDAEEPIVFVTEDGTVQRIVFNYYVD
jgi:hypothetical protein